jgi:hypothetical protein
MLVDEGARENLEMLVVFVMLDDPHAVTCVPLDQHR